MKEPAQMSMMNVMVMSLTKVASSMLCTVESEMKPTMSGKTTSASSPRYDVLANHAWLQVTYVPVNPTDGLEAMIHRASSARRSTYIHVLTNSPQRVAFTLAATCVRSPAVDLIEYFCYHRAFLLSSKHPTHSRNDRKP